MARQSRGWTRLFIKIALAFFGIIVFLIVGFGYVLLLSMFIFLYGG